eukprot:38147_1
MSANVCNHIVYGVHSAISFYYTAILLTLPTTILHIVSKQIGSNESEMSYIFIPITIIGILCSILTGYALNKISNYQYINTTYCFCSSMAIAYIPFAQYYWSVLIAYCIISASGLSLISTICVNIYRFFKTETAEWMMPFNLFICGIGYMLTPQILSLGIIYFNHYSYSMYAFSMCGLVNTILHLAVPIPPQQQHNDNVKLINNDIETDMDYTSETNSTEDIQMTDSIPQLNKPSVAIEPLYGKNEIEIDDRNFHLFLFICSIANFLQASNIEIFTAFITWFVQSSFNLSTTDGLSIIFVYYIGTVFAKLMVIFILR